MCNRIDEEALALMALGFRRVLYVEVNCKQCGYWRVGIDPDATPTCPSCQRNAWTLSVLANGFTRRALPIVEHYLAAPRQYARGTRYQYTSSMPFRAEVQRRARAFRRARQAQPVKA